MADRRTDETPLAPRRSLAGSREGQTRTTDEKQNTNGGGSNGTSNTSQRPGNAQPSSQGNAPTRPANGPQSSQGGSSQSGAGSPPQRPGSAQPSGQGTAQASGQGTAPQARPGGAPSGESAAQRPGGSTDGRKPMADRVNEKVSGAMSAATETVRKVKESRSEERKPSTPATSARPATRPSTASSRPKTRKARLRMTHVDPWSVMKIAFLLSIALGIVTVIAVAMVWSVLGAAGVWDSINQTVQEVIGGQDGSAFDVENYVGASRVLGFTMIVAVVDVVLITAIATLGAFLYNLAATLLGGLEVTLAEEEH